MTLNMATAAAAVAGGIVGVASDRLCIRRRRVEPEEQKETGDAEQGGAAGSTTAGVTQPLLLPPLALAAPKEEGGREHVEKTMTVTASTTGAGDGHYLGSAAGVQTADIAKVAPMQFRKAKAHNAARWHELKIVFCLVGLPARGKSYISLRIMAFLGWLGVDTKVFNVGQHRRKVETKAQDANYFTGDSKNRRDALAFEVLDDLLQWLDSRPQAAAVFDATNSTVERRRAVQQHIQKFNPGYAVIFLESYCDDPEVLEANIAMKLAKSPDYAAMSYQDARADFMDRIRNYEKVYESLDDARDNELSYIKMVNLSSHLVAHKVYGLAATSLLPYLMALHISSRPVWLVRMGQAVDRTADGATSPKRNVFGESTMSKAGEAFAVKFAAYANAHEDMSSARLLVCSHRRALDMAALVDREGQRTSVRSFLSPMDWGIVEGIRRRDFEELADPEFYESFLKDPINTRFPGGESYADFVRRLMPVLVEVEQHVEPVIIIAPYNTLQVLDCYFSKQPVSQAPELTIPMHCVVQWKPDGGNYAQTLLTEEDLGQACKKADGPASPVVFPARRKVGSIMYGRLPSDQAETKSGLVGRLPFLQRPA